MKTVPLSYPTSVGPPSVELGLEEDLDDVEVTTSEPVAIGPIQPVRVEELENFIETGDSIGGMERAKAVVALEAGKVDEVHDLMLYDEDELHVEELEDGWAAIRGNLTRKGKIVSGGHGTMREAMDARGTMS